MWENINCGDFINCGRLSSLLWVVLNAICGKCPNLGVGNVRILGVVNVLLANDSQSYKKTSATFTRTFDSFRTLSYNAVQSLTHYLPFVYGMLNT